MSSYGYPKYVSTAEKKRKAQKAAATQKKKNPEIDPIVIKGNKLATTWWGKAWNKNLESYADYENRIGRGRSYVRYGAVLDLKIDRGRIISLVQGSRAKPYRVEIEIKPLPAGVWKAIKETCAGKIDSLQELVDGKFPEALSELFTARGKGLFPAPKEITFDCSCPDWAYMCKHVAAVLYGVGARLDKNPALFFTLRGIGIEELVTEAIQEKKSAILGKTGVKSRRILKDVDTAAMFGVELEAADMKRDTSKETGAAKKKRRS